jgi:hypothetical protein
MLGGWLVDALSLLAAVGRLGGLVAIVSAIYWLGRRFGEIDGRFRLIDERFQRIDERFKQVDRGLGELESRILGRIERLAGAFTY